MAAAASTVLLAGCGGGASEQSVAEPTPEPSIQELRTQVQECLRGYDLIVERSTGSRLTLSVLGMDAGVIGQVQTWATEGLAAEEAEAFPDTEGFSVGRSSALMLDRAGPANVEVVRSCLR